MIVRISRRAFWPTSPTLLLPLHASSRVLRRMDGHSVARTLRCCAWSGRLFSPCVGCSLADRCDITFPGEGLKDEVLSSRSGAWHWGFEQSPLHQSTLGLGCMSTGRSSHQSLLASLVPTPGNTALSLPPRYWDQANRYLEASKLPELQPNPRAGLIRCCCCPPPDSVTSSAWTNLRPQPALGGLCTEPC